MLSFGIKPAAIPAATAVKAGANITTTLQFENLLSLARAHAFPGRVLVYYSSKTAKADWAHGEKVGAVVDWLQSMGYQFGYLGPYTVRWFLYIADSITFLISPSGTRRSSRWMGQSITCYLMTCCATTVSSLSGHHHYHPHD